MAIITCTKDQYGILRAEADTNEIGAQFDNIAHTIDIVRPVGYDNTQLSILFKYGNELTTEISIGAGNSIQLTENLLQYRKLSVQPVFKSANKVESAVDIIIFDVAQSIRSGNQPAPTPDTGTASRSLVVSYNQTNAADTWTITHNLDRDASTLSVIVIDTSMDIHYPDIDYTSSSNNVIVLKFATAVSGVANISY